MMEMLEYAFMRNGLLAGVLASIACGIIGSIVVSKRIVSLCGGVAHASFGGVGLGYLLRLDPTIGALLFAVLASLGIGTITKKTRHPEDTSIAIMWAVGMSLGILFLALSKGYAPDLFTYLFGNVLAVSHGDLVSIALLDCLVCLVIVLLYKEIVAICFDEEFARLRGIRVFPIYMMLLVLVSLTIVVLMKVVGIILVIALLSLPAATSAKFTKTLKGMMVISALLSTVLIIAGLTVSYLLDLPSGATIILFAALVFVAAEILKRYIRIRRSVSQSTPHA
jgi:zinc transport system permease protein